MSSKKFLALNLVVLLLAGCGNIAPANDASMRQNSLSSSAVILPAKSQDDSRKTITVLFKNAQQLGFNTKAAEELFVKAIVDRINSGDHKEINLLTVGGTFSFTITADIGDEINIRIEAKNTSGVLLQEGTGRFTVNANTKEVVVLMKSITQTVSKESLATVITGSLNPPQVVLASGSMTLSDNTNLVSSPLPPPPLPSQSSSPLPPPPSPLPSPSSSGLSGQPYSQCGVVPLPPPNIMDRIKIENPALLTQVQATQSMTFLDGYNTMVNLANQYPQYFMPPPPLPADGTCPPPPPPPPQR